MFKAGFLYLILLGGVVGDARTQAPQYTTYQMIPVSAFRPFPVDNEDDTWSFSFPESRGGYGAIVAGNRPYDVYLIAPVILPHKATVTELTAYYWDRSPGDSLSLQLSLAHQNQGANLGMAIVRITTTRAFHVDSVMSQSATDIDRPTNDASRDRVWLALKMTVSRPTTRLGFFGARITYTAIR